MTTKEEISMWFDTGLAMNCKWMLVVTDTVDWVDYPVYASTNTSNLRRFKC